VLRWTEESKRKQAEISRRYALAKGGVPNAVKFTKGSTAGEKNHRWRGGITPEIVKLRNSEEAIAWRDAIFKRDNYTCQICGKRGGTLTAHHIYPWSKHPELRFDLINGITVCDNRKTQMGCHIQILHRGAWSNLPMVAAEISELRGLVASGSVSIDWDAA
jgi:hypothetical protein